MQWQYLAKSLYEKELLDVRKLSTVIESVLVRVFGLAIPIKEGDELKIPTLDNYTPASFIFTHPLVAKEIITKYQEYWKQEHALEKASEEKDLSREEIEQLFEEYDDIFEGAGQTAAALKTLNQKLGIPVFEDTDLLPQDMGAHFAVRPSTRKKSIIKTGPLPEGLDDLDELFDSIQEVKPK